MSTVDPEYVQVWQQVRQWPTGLRRNLAEEIIESLEADAPAPNGEWTEAKNARRCELIDKGIQGTISEAEGRELESLTHQMRVYRRRVAPIPIEGARKLHKQLLEKKRQQQRSSREET